MHGTAKVASCFWRGSGGGGGARALGWAGVFQALPRETQSGWRAVSVGTLVLGGAGYGRRERCCPGGRGRGRSRAMLLARWDRDQVAACVGRFDWDPVSACGARRGSCVPCRPGSDRGGWKLCHALGIVVGKSVMMSGVRVEKQNGGVLRTGCPGPVVEKVRWIRPLAVR